MKRIIDLTHIIDEDINMFPGDKKPEIEKINTIDKDGFNQTEISLYSHTGTHIDAPSHMLKGGLTLDKLDIEHFVGKAAVFDFSGTGREYIEVGDLKPAEAVIRNVDFLLINTGWSRKWKSEGYLKGYPALSKEAVRWLTNFDLKGIGFDTISPDKVESEEFYVHKTLLQYGILIIENLKNLDLLPLGTFEFSAVPIRYRKADGAPVCAYAVIDEE